MMIRTHSQALLLLAAASLVSVGCDRDARPSRSEKSGEAATADRGPGPKIIAHRGASRQAPENTLAAIERAWELGAHGVEIDVRLSADREVVVIHDRTTRRTGGLDRPVAAQTLAELRLLDAGGGERIPTLREAIETVPVGRTLFVEIKTGPGSVPTIVESIRRTERLDRVAIEAFDLEVVRAARKSLPDTDVFWLVKSKRKRGRYRPIDTRVVERATDAGATGIAFDWRGATPELMTAMRKRGLTLYVWTVDAPGVARRFGSVAWLETNYPDRFAPSP